MAEVVPFRGVLYNPEVIPNMADVVAPPYDVISPKEQEAFYQQHPNNVIRLILGKAKTGDSGQKDIHARASKSFYQWMNDGILVQDNEPAFYLTNVTFKVEDQLVTRYGIIGSVRLEPFDKGIVLPHEKTFSKVKSERLQLMQVCHTNFSPIFGLYADGKNLLNSLKEKFEIQAPDMELTDNKGLLHKLWRIHNPEIQEQISNALQDQCIYIADGHHRYETALDYRDWVKENNPDFDSNHPANFVMMSLSSLNDPGMVIFPAHRLIKQVAAEKIEAFMPKAKDYFDINSFSIEAGMDAALSEFDRALTANSDKNAIGLYIKDQSHLYVLVLKQGVMDRLFANELEEPIRDLDVSVLRSLLMLELMQFSQARLDDATKIGYATTSRDAVKAIQQGEADMAFILNPTKIEQVQRVAQKGLIMPRKSTYFYPKVISGQVINLLLQKPEDFRSFVAKGSQ